MSKKYSDSCCVRRILSRADCVESASYLNSGPLDADERDISSGPLSTTLQGFFSRSVFKGAAIDQLLSPLGIMSSIKASNWVSFVSFTVY